ncbi:MAG: hypothetical protein A2W94_11685 [Bacteroidetes bacterium GWE2_42_42]|nr:MAG: hypothetical protein A2W94_11685 [Bacteroidetes bacterium GWE2_42_42]
MDKSGKYSCAYVLGSTSSSLQSACTGYAVFMGGNVLGNNAIALVRFYTNGVDNFSSVLTSTVLPANLTNYMSVKVTYNPVGNSWSLYVRDDGTTGFSDPAAGTYSAPVTGTDANYTSVSLPFAGFYWQGNTDVAQSCYGDNVKVTLPAAGAPTVNLWQYLYPTGIGNENQEIVQVAVTASSAMTLTQLNLQMTGTTAISDVSNIDVYYMGTSYRYNPAAGTIFGSATPAAGNIAINGSQPLSVGTHYFYVVYDVSSSAVEGNLLDVMVNSVVAGGNTVVPTDVSGSRTILLSQARLARCDDDGSEFYRIPAITTCPDGSLLTAYDKRWNNGEDLGVTATNSIDIVSRRSTDGGKTWSTPITIAGNHTTYCYTDPCFITDYQTGVIFCLMASGTGTANRFSASTPTNPIKIYKIESHDNGLSWINGVDITNSIYGSLCSNATRRAWFAGVVSPGSGIQMNNGRLAALLQTRTTSATTPIHDFLIYSDDHGATWTCGTNSAYAAGAGNEAQLVQRADGTILASIRHTTNRYMNTSSDNGITWGTVYSESEITEPGCNGDIARLTTIAGGSDKNRLVQSIPFHASIRTNISVMLSNDDGNNWPYRKVIYPDMGTTSIGSAYSTLCVLPDNTIGLVYELSDTIPYNAAWAYPYEQIHFVRFSLNWLTGGAESLCQPTGFTAPTSNSPQCTNGSITFTQGSCPSGYTCYWQASADGTSTANSSSTLTVTQGTPGNYTAYVRGYNGSCWTQALSCVGTFNQAPTGVTAIASDNSICAGDAINLSSSAIITETLISPTVEGSFDPGTTFPLNGWSVVNGASNIWYCGAFAGALSGMNSAYIGTATTYAGTSAVRANHFYRDVAIPAGSSNLVLSFYLKMPTIDNNADFVRVYTTTTSNIPVAGTTPGAGYTQVYNYTTPALASYTFQTITLPDALAGTTVRLVFTYICDATTGNANPSIDNISLTANTADFSWTSSPTGFTSSLQNPTGVTPAVSTTYTVTASATNGCSETASTTITVSSVTPTFDQLGPYCVGDIPGTLPTTSLNSIAGAWSPSSISTATAGITTYTFTPDAGQCASVVTMDVTINGAATTPTFTQLGPYCVGATPATLPTTSINGITGTWNAAISTASAASTVYTFTPTAGQCATTATMTVVVNDNVTPTFTQLSSYCVGAIPDALPATSTNGITGTWSPATISTASAGSTVYTFTPTAGQCATTATMIVVVNANIDPTFTQLGPYCVGATPATLPTTSLNGITGTWNAAISTASAASTVYTFTPTAGQCATTATMTVVVNDNVTPTFTQLGPYCVGATPATLPTTSINGITGTWNAAISTASAASTVYTFTPTAGQCATTATMTVVVNANITPTFTQLGPYCVGSTPGTLPTTSNNGITGTWNAVISTVSAASTVYTFTPTAGQCATLATMTVVVNANITPTFTQLGPYCVGATPATLPTTSLNGITGTWNAAISTASAASTVYTFTPTAGQCATLATMTVVVNANITPTFTQLGPYCVGSTPGTLPTTSINGFTGTWNAAISTANAASTVYTFTPTAGQCATTATMSVVVNANIVPTFTQLGPYCVGATPATLPTTSNNGITGTWDAAISTASAASTVYTFTPTAGQCATTATMTVVVNDNVTPTFTQLSSYCVGAIPDALPATSTNGITGTWSPATISTASAGSTVYTFTPTAGQCATTATMIVVVNANIDPTFTQLGPYCVGATPATLPTTSLNGITGTWNAAISTASAASTVYTFTPTAGQCATLATMTVVVNANITPTFTQLGPYCVGATPATLPTTSLNGITGTWNAAISTASTASTVYTFTPTAGQCATTATMIVVVSPSYAFNENHSICNGDSYTWHGTTYTTAGTFTKSYTTVNGCDSVFTLNFTVNPTYAFNEDHSICNGDSYTWHGTTYTAAGTFTKSYTTVNGCDSIYTLNLSVNPTYSFNEEHSICNGDSYTWHGTTYTTAGIYAAAYTTVNGCDSIYTLNLTEVTSFSFVEDHSICSGDSYIWQGSTYNTTGTYTAIYVSSTGCDSIYTLNLTVNPTYAFNEDHAICNGDSYTWHGTTYTAAGTFTKSYTTVNGCDSIYTLNLSVNPTYAFNEDHSICNGDSYTWHGTTYAAAGTFTKSYTTVNGCDSVFTLNLTVNPTYAFNEDHSICNGNSYTWHGTTYTTGGIYTAAYTTVYGCDSIYILNLTVNPTYAFNEDHSICNGNSYTWHGTTYTAGGTYTAAYTTVNGCDSVFTLNLTVNPTYAFNENHTICEGDVYNWHGNIYSTEGIYYDSLQSQTGCDSTFTLNLTVNPLPDIFLGNDTTICADAFILLDAGNPGATYLWSEAGANGQTIIVDSTGQGLSTFDVSVTVNNGCVISDTISITIEVCDAIDENGDNIFSVFPNPSDEIVNIISSNQFSDAQIELTDINGKLVYCSRMTDLNGITGNKQFDLGEYPAGVYFMHFITGTHVQVIRVVRQ